MIYAELRKEDSGNGYFTLRYLVYNGDTIGSYGVHYKPWDHAHSVPYGATRDSHRLATERDIAAHEEYKRYEALSEAEQERYDEEHNSFPYAPEPFECVYHGDKLSMCDGSSLVEVITNEQRAFEVAALMAEVTSDN